MNIYTSDIKTGDKFKLYGKSTIYACVATNDKGISATSHGKPLPSMFPLNKQVVRIK